MDSKDLQIPLPRNKLNIITGKTVSASQYKMMHASRFNTAMNKVALVHE
jgi:hypothetical protein